MAKILITGGAGFIGTNFVRHWRSVCPEDEILVLDALTYAGTAMNLVGLDQVR
jgi:dTDP-glucose 4,6-dehydratase